MMTLIKRNEFPVFGDRMSNLFEDDFFAPFINKPQTKTVPKANIHEEEKAFKISVAAPGMKKEQFSIDLDGNLLKVSAETEKTKKEETKYSLKEYSYSSFLRTFRLPKNADQKNISATYFNGILEVSIPKKKHEKKVAKKIEIA